MYQQMGLTDRQRLEGRINTLLFELDPGGELDTTLLRRYTPWAEMAEIPAEALEQVLRDLQAEVKARAAMEEPAYFATVTGTEKVRLYLRAVLAVPEHLRAAGRNPAEGLTFAEFRRALNACITAAAPTAEDAPLPELTRGMPPKAAAPKGKPRRTAKKKPPRKKKAATKRKAFTPPTVDEVAAYCTARHNTIDPRHFVDYYEAAEWVDSEGKPVLNWKQRVITWEKCGGRAPGAIGGQRVVGRGNNLQPVGPKPTRDVLGEAEYIPLKERAMKG